MLTARAARTVGVNAQILRPYINFDCIINNGENVNRGERSVPPRVRVERADAHKPVDAGLAFQITVNKIAVYLTGGGLYPSLSFLPVNFFDLKTFLFRPAKVHAVKHLRPVARFGSARS